MDSSYEKEDYPRGGNFYNPRANASPEIDHDHVSQFSLIKILID